VAIKKAQMERQELLKEQLVNERNELLEEGALRKKEEKLRVIYRTMEKSSFLKEKRKQEFLDKQIQMEE
jgi:hypothetical protein